MLDDQKSDAASAATQYKPMVERLEREKQGLQEQLNLWIARYRDVEKRGADVSSSASSMKVQYDEHIRQLQATLDAKTNETVVLKRKLDDQSRLFTSQITEVEKSVTEFQSSLQQANEILRRDGMYCV